MKRNIHSYPKKSSKIHTEKLKTCKKLLENLANNLITF